MKIGNQEKEQRKSVSVESKRVKVQPKKVEIKLELPLKDPLEKYLKGPT